MQSSAEESFDEETQISTEIVTPITFLKRGRVDDKRNKYEEYFKELEAYRESVRDLIEVKGALDIDSLEDDERDIVMLNLTPGGKTKILFKANMKLYDWQVTDDASNCLVSIEKDFMPMPTRPFITGSTMGTLVFTLTARDDKGYAFDILQIE